MKIEFDTGKDDANRAKHGLSLEAAAKIDLLESIIVEDTRRDDGERRYIATARSKAACTSSASPGAVRICAPSD